MRVYHVVLAAVVLGTALPVGLHLSTHGHANPHQIALAFFLWLNTIIAFWEICLSLRIDLIEEQFARFLPMYKGRELDRVKDFFGAPLRLGQIASFTTWAEIWSSYAVFDDSYANRKSFGFFIDFGNGYSTLIPSLLCVFGMTYELMPARIFGLMLFVLNYQMWYGTVVYFLSFVFNKRYVGHTPGNLAIFVGLSNGIWMIFPIWAMVVGYWMIANDSYAIFR